MNEWDLARTRTRHRAGNAVRSRDCSSLPGLALALLALATIVSPACRTGSSRGDEATARRLETAGFTASGPGGSGAGASGRAGVEKWPSGEEPTASEAVVRPRPVEDLFILTGELHAIRSLDLVTPRSEMWQVQIKWLAEDGTDAKPGERLIEFDNTSVAQTIEEKRLSFVQKGIDLESRRASLTAEGEEKRFAHEKARGVAEKARVQASIPKEIQSLHDWQEKQAAQRRADAELEKARLELQSFEVTSKAEIENLEIARDKAARDIQAAQRTLEALAVKSPKNGIFVINENWNEDRKFQVGDTCWPGMVIASIPDLTAMEVVAYLSDVDEGRIAAGMPARCVLDTYQDRVFNGKIEEIGSVADRKGFRVRVSLDRSDAALMRPGMSVRVEVVRRAWEHALTIPKQAVRRAGGKTWVSEPSHKEPVEVRIAACTPTDCVVESGLGEGDRVRLHGPVTER